jgi:hypothetical protein
MDSWPSIPSQSSPTTGIGRRLWRPPGRSRRSAEPAVLVYSPDWIILTRNEPLLAAQQLFAAPPPVPAPPVILWTDTRSNLFDVLK